MSDLDSHDLVLVVTTHDAKVRSIVSEGRVVYKNTKGEYIKVRGYGNVFLQRTENGTLLAVIEYIKWRKPKVVKFAPVTLQWALHEFFEEHGLTEFIREI